jgi:hypothetical protein
VVVVVVVVVLLLLLLLLLSFGALLGVALLLVPAAAPGCWFAAGSGAGLMRPEAARGRRAGPVLSAPVATLTPGLLAQLLNPAASALLTTLPGLVPDPALLLLLLPELLPLPLLKMLLLP